MDVPIGAKVICLDGEDGRVSHVIVNPVSKVITHLVVHTPGLFGSERMVPLSEILSSDSESVHLRLSKADLAKATKFVESEYLTPDMYMEAGFIDYPEAAVMFWPYVVPIDYASSDPFLVLGTIPQDELAIRRGDAVIARDGRVGRVDEFLIDPVSNAIAQLVLREGHLWEQKDITIPVKEIERLEEGAVYLKLSKDQIAALPVTRIRRQSQDAVA
jgi:uncharacterized protein YrrD